MNKLAKATDWILTILLAVLFVSTGFSKVSGASARGWAQRFRNWGYPAEFGSVIGAVEILAGAFLPIPRLRRAAVTVLLIVMLGAAGTHLWSGEYVRVIPPLILGGLLLLTVATLPKESRLKMK